MKSARDEQQILMCPEHQFVIVIHDGWISSRGSPGHRRTDCPVCEKVVADAVRAPDVAAMTESSRFRNRTIPDIAKAYPPGAFGCTAELVTIPRALFVALCEVGEATDKYVTECGYFVDEMESALAVLKST